MEKMENEVRGMTLKWRHTLKKKKYPSENGSEFYMENG